MQQRSQKRVRISWAIVGAVLLVTALVTFPRITLAIFALAALIVAAAAACLYLRLYRSRPLLNGRLEVSGIHAQVTIKRDAAGIPIVSGASRADVAFGLGFLHAQERFFQMDMSRRAAAGELAELLGKGFVSTDRRARLHQFRKRAEQVHAALSTDQRELLDSYTAGVGAGLRTLRAPPLEYLILRSRPTEWRSEDTILIVFNLYRLLQDDRADQDFNRYLIYAALPQSIADFLAPEGSPDWDAPLIGPPSPAMRIPGPEVLDFRRASPKRIPHLKLRPTPVPGSNAWAVSGEHTKSGKAIVANDMHLPFDMPPIFYRATLDVAGRGPGGCLSGITMPGFPFLLAGTNGEIAWGLANAAIDSVDLVRLDQAGLPPTAYHTADGVKLFESEREIIRVRGGADAELMITKTLWGPVARKTRDGLLFAQSWVAHHAEAVNLAWCGLETASSAADAMEAANNIGVPTLAIVVGDRHGDVGWTLAGPLPRRTKGTGRLPPTSSQITGEQWDYVQSSHYPRLRSPEFSRVWAANARSITSGAFGELLAGGYHVCGARASQIRDGLLGLDSVDEESMLRIQRDDRALFLSRWHALFLEVLHSGKMTDHPRLAVVRAALKCWNGRASADSVAYRLLRQFRDAVECLVFEPFISIVRARQGQFDLPSVTDQLEAPLWRLVTERPAHLLPPWFADWDALMSAAALEILGAVPEELPLRSFVWGAVNTLTMRHALSPFVPIIGRLLDARRAQLDGDLNMPLAQTPRHGPVFRFVISPGDDRAAVAQMAGGQAGNPLAPYYLSGHADWLAGTPSPLHPGSTRYVLTLDPLARA
jgi:penicillin amidase